MNYELGKQYEMRVVDTGVDSSGRDYMTVCDERNHDKSYRIYNIIKSQIENPPSTMFVRVKCVDEFERVKFQQDEAQLYREHYKAGKMYGFEVVDVRTDNKTMTSYYVIEDDFASHRYYFDGDQKYMLGDTCILEVKGFKNNGFLKLAEVKHHIDDDVEIGSERVETSEQEHTDDRQNFAMLDLDESQRVELKSSIAFPPNSGGEPDIDTQLFNIMKELTAFMNTDGGTLYIGIHDKTKKVVGIEGDFPYLNSGNDTYNGSYGCDIDGYELKIRNTVDCLCPSFANSLLTFAFESLGGKTYCLINVNTAPKQRPVFLGKNNLYIRQGNRLKSLMRDDVTRFISDRIIEAMKIQYDPEAMKSMMRELLNERSYVPVDILPQRQVGEIENWIVWYNDGTWKRKRNESDEANVSFQLPVYKELKDGLLAFCYDNNKVNVISVKEFQKKVVRDKLETRKPGWSRKGKPMNIFLMHPTDYLVGYSIDVDGIQHVKLQSISDLGTTRGAINEGNLLLPKGHKIQAYAMLGSEHKKKVEHLIVPKGKKTSDAGPALTSPTLQGEIAYLKKIIEQK